MKHTPFEYDLDSIESDNYSYVKLAYENSGNTKVLFILDHMPTEDMTSGKLLSGVTGDLLNSLLGYTKKTYGKPSTTFSWLAVTFNGFRTYGKSADYRASAEELFKKRINKLICKYKPEYVVAFGTSVMRALLADKLVNDKRNRTRFSYWLGVPVKRTITSGSATHNTVVVSNISLNDIVSGEAAEASLLGYMGKCLAPIVGKVYAVDSDNILSKGSTVIDTLSKFDKLMDVLAEKKAVAIDSETKNLNKITNQLLTVQFAYSAERGFLIPLAHKDSPFQPSEIHHIYDRLRDYFEGANNNEYHIYTHAKFDLTQFRSAIGVRWFKNPVWDILGGEFCLAFGTLVATEVGFIAIQDLVRMEIRPRVWSFNHATGEKELKNVFFGTEFETEKDMYELEYEGGTLQCTGDHKVWSHTRQAYVEVKDLLPGEDVVILA